MSLFREPEWSFARGDRPFEPVAGSMLGELFATGLANFPERDAISDGKTTLSFDALDGLAWRIAARLRELGTVPGDRIAVIGAKSALMPAIAVAIWKCGATYVPLDQDVPATRMDALIGRIDPRAIVCCETDVTAGEVPVIPVAELAAMVTGPDPVRWPLPSMAPDDLAYIIFTSGSTGEPKGVEITVASLLIYFRVHNRVLQFDHRSRVLSFAPYHFDVSIEDTLLPLSVGAFSWQYRGMYVGALIRKLMKEQRITHMIAVSTILSLISHPAEAVSGAAFPDLGMLMTGAEVCDPKIISHWVAAKPDLRVFNAYGPTETTIVCLCHQITEPEPDRTTSFPIGTPLDQVSLLLLDDDGKDGASGELCIGGPLVMRGYWQRPDLTERAIFERDGIRYYRSGDFCTRLPDGTIQFVGRRDDEAKVNGRRIHLGEVRQTAMALKGVDRAVVGVVERVGRPEIALVVFGKRPEDMAGLRELLAERLPGYMVPSIWAHGAQASRSASGKTDEKTLMQRLREVAAQSRHTEFELTDDGNFTPRTRITAK